MTVSERRQVQRHTFYLLGCERCGQFDPPPKRQPMPDFVEGDREPMRCADCGDTLLLAECWLAPETTMWQPKRGAMWQHVAFRDLLPDRDGRMVWTDA